MPLAKYQGLRHQSLTQYVSQIILQSNTPLIYQAGQYVKVIHHDNSESPLSIACAPNEKNLIELHLSHHPGNLPAQDIMQMVSQEKELQISGPYGSCTSAKLLADIPIIFLARGTGFASVKALLEELIQKDDQRHIHLFWDAATEDKFYLLDLIEQWREKFHAFHFTPITSHSKDREKMHLAVTTNYPDLSNYQVYASGSEEMVIAALENLQQFGMRKERFYSDLLDY